MTRTARIAVLVAALLGLAAAPAPAAVRHATPAPAAGADCSAAAPCSLQTAVDGSLGGEEIVVAPGSYAVSAPLNERRLALHVHGVAGEPRPLIVSSVQSNPALFLRGGSLRHVSFEVTGGGGRAVSAEDVPAQVEGIAVSAPTSGSGIGVDFYRADGSMLANSTIEVGGANATGVYVRRSKDVQIRHVTAVASGMNGTAVEVVGAIDRDASATIRNSIFVGAKEDLLVAEVAPFQASADVDYSNVVPARVLGGGEASLGAHNQALDPVGLQPGGHLPEGSPLIDAGLADAASPALDIDGQPRPIGLAPDVGADEAPFAPTATTAAASAVGRTGATLHGELNPNGARTTYRFEYGTTPALGRTTPELELQPGLAPIPVAVALDGLEPGSDYHARLLAENERGVSAGGTVTFTTAPAEAAPETDPGAVVTPGGDTTPRQTVAPERQAAPAAPAAPMLSVARTRATVRHGVALIPVTCAGAAGACRATVSLRRAGRRTARIALDPGRRGTVRIRLSPRALRALHRSGRLRVRAVVTPHGGRPVARTITLRGE